MDSLSQALLGSASFALVKEQEIGRKAIWIGALAGTIPDLDVLLAPFYDQVTFIGVHRSLTHSILFAVLGALIFGFISHWWSKKKYRLWKWNLAYFLAFITHSLLDCCTTYGTKLLYPFSQQLFTSNNIHVIEPIYTLILLIAVVFYLIKKKRKVIIYGLIISILYLAWTFISKNIATHQFQKCLKKEEIVYDKILVSPTPFNSLLWNAVVKTKEGYYLGNYSLMDKKEPSFYFEASENYLISKISSTPKGYAYLNFTMDFPLIKEKDGLIKIYAIKFGPNNYYGQPTFIYPLCIDYEKPIAERFWIEKPIDQKGPVSDFKLLYQRVLGK